jgi:hypothetical protein
MTHVSRFARYAVAIAALGAATVPASAEHEARDNPEVVAAKLNHMGFESWRRLRWEHGFWDVDNALRANGRKYDLKLEAETLDLVKLQREDH